MEKSTPKDADNAGAPDHCEAGKASAPSLLLVDSDAARGATQNLDGEGCTESGDRGQMEIDGDCEKRVALDGENGSTNGVKRKRKHRRNKKGGKHHRRSWDERRNLEQKAKRLCVKRTEPGQPMAPRNTTQFLMEQHEPSEADLNLDKAENNSTTSSNVELYGPAGAGGGSGSGENYDSSSDYDGMPDDDEAFMNQERDFTEAYESFQAERLQSMTKEELIREHLDLETKLDRMQKQVKDTESRNAPRDSDAAASGQTSSRVAPLGGKSQSINGGGVPSLEAQIARLTEENTRLRKENELLKSRTLPSGL